MEIYKFYTRYEIRKEDLRSSRQRSMPERYGTLQRYDKTAGSGSTGLPAEQFCIALCSFVSLPPVVVVEDFGDCPRTRIYLKAVRNSSTEAFH